MRISRKNIPVVDSSPLQSKPAKKSFLSKKAAMLSVAMRRRTAKKVSLKHIPGQQIMKERNSAYSFFSIN